MASNGKLCLEPHWNGLNSNELVDVQGDLIVHDIGGKKHLFRSTINKQLFTVQGQLANLQAYSFLQCRIQVNHGRFHLDACSGFALGLPTPTTAMFQGAIEVCSGIAMMSQGFVSCGMEVKATNDLQETNCAFQTRQGHSNVVQGDINDAQVVANLHAAYGSPVLLSGGFSCQPWSVLGDKAGMKDPRAKSLIGTLRAAFYLRAFAIQLECVVEASRDKEVRAVIHEYCKLTQFRQSEVELSLDAMMPTKRTRWWCMLTNGTLPQLNLTPLPCLSRQPVVGDVIPVCPAWPSHHMSQLELDQYETRKFAAFGGIEQNMVRHNAVLRTALHGWANQLTACPCKCRQFPMSEERLQSKGMFGALVRIAGEFQTSSGHYPKTRHLHPWEMCVIHGGIPEFEWHPMRFSIAALGQMASPVQSCWITGHLLAACDEVQNRPVRLPEEHLWNHFCRLAKAVEVTQPQVHGAEGFQSYIQEVRGVLLSRVASAKVPQSIAAPEKLEKNEVNSQRSGCKNLQPANPNGEKEQPAVKTQELVKENKQPGRRTPEPVTKKAEETQKLHPPMCLQAMPSSAPVTGGPAPHLIRVEDGTHDAAAAKSGVTKSLPPMQSLHQPTGGITAFASHAKTPNSVAATQAKVAGEHAVRNQAIGPTAVAECHTKPPLNEGHGSSVGHPNGHTPMNDKAASVPAEAICGKIHGAIGQADHVRSDTMEHNDRIEAGSGGEAGLTCHGSPPQPVGMPLSMQNFNTVRLAEHHESRPITKRDPPRVNPADTAMDNDEYDEHATHEAMETCMPPHIGDAMDTAPLPGDVHSHKPTGEAMEETDHDGLTQDMLQVVQQAEKSTLHTPVLQSHAIQIIRQDDDVPTFIKVQPDTTVGAITVAEAKLGSMTPPICVNTCVGTRIQSAAITTPFQQVFLKEMAKYGSGRTSEEITMPPELKECRKFSRLALLYRQEAYVADDEMHHYMSMLTATGQAIHTPLAIVPDKIDDEDLIQLLQDWFAQAMVVAEGPCTLVTAIFAHHHWFPVGMKFAHGNIQVFTTPGGHDWVHVATREMGATCSIHTIAIDNCFPNDCGFQCIAWIMSFVFDPTHHLGQFKPVNATTAIAWRGLFEHHLITSGSAKRVVVPKELSFGGTTGGDLTMSLQNLLMEHGVPKEHAEDRANVICDKLGRTTVARTLRSAQPWRELKQIANQCSPKLQLVLASELQAIIQARTDKQQKFGSKQAKKKSTPQPKTPIQLNAEDIGIPDGIFQDASGHAIHQKTVANIGPEASGIIVVHAKQAVPYLKFAQPVSSKGLALLVLNHHDPLMQGLGEEIRFPARYEKTSEPILISAKLVQLGASIVSRVVPDQALKIDEVHNSVIRVVMFRDEIEKKWEHIIDKPVKYMVSAVKILQPQSDGTSSIMDVWDRQWLNEKLERTRPAEASLFMATFRMERGDVADALKGSGTAGCYVEPRSSDGRTPAPEYRVIWLNKSDKQSAMIASQSTVQWTCIVRSGNRFGLRVTAQDAQKVHEQHKPLTPFLTSDQVTTFHVGPIPHGSNRTALTKLFQSWSWQARPCQPKSRTPDGKGVVWECQAICKPPFEVYQLEHADVLITEVPRKHQKQAAAQSSIQASAKTLAVLKAAETKDAPDQDPWEIDDPWGNYATPVKAAKKMSIPESKGHDDIDLLAAKVQRKLQSTWQPNAGTKMDVDADTHDDTRIQTVEDRLAKLEHTVQANHTQQGQHVQELANQIAQVQHNVDQQGKAFQAHLDDKLDKQLQQIEQLLTKRSRTE